MRNVTQAIDRSINSNMSRLSETSKERTKEVSEMRMARDLILTIHSQAYTTSNWKRRNER